MSQKIHKEGLKGLGELAEKKWIWIILLAILAVALPFALFFGK